MDDAENYRRVMAHAFGASTDEDVPDSVLGSTAELTRCSACAFIDPEGEAHTGPRPRRALEEGWVLYETEAQVRHWVCPRCLQRVTHRQFRHELGGYGAWYGIATPPDMRWWARWTKPLASPFVPVRVGEGLEPDGACSRKRGFELRAAQLLELDLVGELGRGGMGVVYEACSEAGERFAVKVLSPRGALTAEQGDRFRREARLLATLEHPNIVGFECYAEHVDLQCLVMEFVTGKSLAHAIEAGPLPRARGLQIAIEVCSALAHTHAQGIVHRDVKPSNILLTDTGVAKLVDFGIGKLPGGGPRFGTVTAGAQVAGTAGYLPPEALDDPQPTPAWDVYAMGATLYEALTGTAPARGHDTGVWLEPVDGQLDPILRRATASAPERRYADAGALRDALWTCLRGE